jgi:glycine/D-amino acid oxidase-like deaminating enzyme
VAVVGGGYTGLSAARTLAKGGAKVAVLEEHTVGWGASSRNGGMVLTGLKLDANTLISRYGREATKRMYAASLESIDCVERIVREENIACDLALCGHLEVACKPTHFDDFCCSAEVIAREFSHHLRVVTKSELRAEIGSEIYHGGLVDERSAGVNPARYVSGLARAAERAGAEICEGSRVEQIDPEARVGTRGWKLRTSRGALWAREVLVATSGYTSKATPALQKRIVPIGSYIIVTEILPEKLAVELSPRKRMIYDSKNYLYYYRLTPDRRILFWRQGGVFSGNEQNDSKECRDSAPRDARCLPAIGEREGRICVGWNAGLCVRYSSARRKARRDVFFTRICRARGGHGDVPGRENRALDSAW